MGSKMIQIVIPMAGEGKRFKQTKWNLYYSPKLKAEHDIRKPTGEYAEYRNRNFKEDK